MESLLSFLEFVQFKYYIKNKLNINEEIKWKLNEDELPKSYIVYESQNDNDINSFIQIVLLLFDKYIDFESDLEINISYIVRKEYVKQINKIRSALTIDNINNNNHKIENIIDKNKLFHFFDEVIGEITYLMKSSYFRCTHDISMDTAI